MSRKILLLSVILAVYSCLALGQSQVIFHVAGEETQVDTETTATIEIIQATQGIGALEGVFQLEGIPGQILDFQSDYKIQVTEQTEQALRFRWLDMEDRIDRSVRDVEFLTVSILPEEAGELQLGFSTPFLSDDEGEKSEVLVESKPLVITAPKPAALLPVVEGAGLPRDLDTDGLYEDINGDGVFDIQDLNLFEGNWNQEIIQMRPAAFDFDGDGQLTVRDVDALASQLPITDLTTSLKLPGGEVELDKETELEFVLIKAPQGIQRFDIKVNIRDQKIARVQGIHGITIPKPFFQVIEQTESSVEFRAADLEDRIDPGAEQLVLAKITVVGIKEGETDLTIKLNDLIGDNGKRIEPSIESGPVSVLAVPEPVPVEWAPIGNSKHPPQDLDGDGLFEDIDGDSQFAPEDIARFTYNINNRIIQENRAAFDMDGDGDVDLDDALALASLIEIPSSSFTSISLGDKRAVLSPDVELNVTLDRAPQGLRGYVITILLEDSSIARLEGIESRAIDGRFFEVVSQTASKLVFRAIDLKDEIPRGAEDLSLATIRLKALKAGHTAIWGIVTRTIDDQGNDINPLVRAGRLEFVAFTIGSATAPPTDMDGDGLFEDINGDGRLTFEDVLILSFNISGQMIQENCQLFDFNSDGEADFDDAKVLYELVEKAEM